MVMAALEPSPADGRGIAHHYHVYKLQLLALLAPLAREVLLFLPVWGRAWRAQRESRQAG